MPMHSLHYVVLYYPTMKGVLIMRAKMSETVYVVTLDPEDVRELCIEKQFYTRGDCRAYDTMLSMCGRGLKPDDVLSIAQDIVDHTDPQNEWIASYEALDEVTCYLQDLLKVEVMCYCLAPEFRVRAIREETPACKRICRR